MKKVLSLILVAILCGAAVVALVACDPNSFEDEGVEVIMYTNMGGPLSNIVADYIKEFNRIYPGIKVTHTPLGGQYSDLKDRVQKEIDNNNGPSLTYCYPDHVADYINSGNKVVCLDKFIDSTETVPAGKFGNEKEMKVGFTADEKADFYEAFYNEGKESYGDGTKMYSLPFAKSSEVMYYNKTFFDEHSDRISVPDHWFANGANDKTSMEYVCQEILAITNNNCYPLGYDSEDNFFITMAEQLQTLPENAGKQLYTVGDVDKSADHYVFDNPEMRELMAKFNDWFNKNYFRTKSTNGNAYMSTAFKGEDKNVKQCYMCIGSTGGATYQVPDAKNFETGIAPIPQMNPDNPKVISQGPSICMLRNSNNSTADEQLASWLWLKYITTNVNLQARISMSNGYAPVIKSVRENPVYKNQYISLPNGISVENRVKAMAVLQCFEQADSYFTSPSFPGSSLARDKVGALFVACIGLNDNASGTVAQQIQAQFTLALNACKLYGIQ